jgi:hypothetical protein
MDFYSVQIKLVEIFKESWPESLQDQITFLYSRLLPSDKPDLSSLYRVLHL